MENKEYILGIDPIDKNINSDSFGGIIFVKEGGNLINLNGGVSYMNEAGLKEFDKAVKRLAKEYKIIKA